MVSEGRRGGEEKLQEEKGKRPAVKKMPQQPESTEGKRESTKEGNLNLKEGTTKRRRG